MLVRLGRVTVVVVVWVSVAIMNMLVPFLHVVPDYLIQG
jgi:hypothetical protein